MRPIILYRRPGYEDRDVEFVKELEAMNKHFLTVGSRMDVCSNELIIPRYSSLPYYKELEYDVNIIDSQLINSYRQHEYVADLNNYYWDLEGITPKTWMRPCDVPTNEEGSFVLKGKTNSKKFCWDTLMFAADRSKIMDVYCGLQEDSLIGCQDIYIRKFVPLYNYAISVRSLPISKEFRFFVAYKQILCGAFYWSSFAEWIKEQTGSVPSADEVPMEFLKEVIGRVGDKINAYVIDIAQTVEDEWIVVELNDFTMSGLCENEPEILYSRLKEVLMERDIY